MPRTNRLAIIGLGLLLAMTVCFALPHYAGWRLSPPQLVVSEITVDLNTSATVEVYRHQDLIYSQKLSAGRHILDTTHFPLGRYPIKVVTKPADAGQSTLNLQFFKKYVSIYQTVDKLEVDLFYPAEVTVSDGNKVIYTGHYPSGIHTIDTTAFPQGTYPVVIQAVGNKGKYDVKQQVVFHK